MIRYHAHTDLCFGRIERVVRPCFELVADETKVIGASWYRDPHVMNHLLSPDRRLVVGVLYVQVKGEQLASMKHQN